MPTVLELLLSLRHGSRAPPHSVNEIRELVEPHAQRMFGYMQAQTNSARVLAQDPVKRDSMLQRDRQKNPQAAEEFALANYVQDDQDPYDILHQHDTALSVPGHTFEEHFARMRHATAAAVILSETKHFEFHHDVPLRAEFEARWRYLHDHWLEESQHSPQPQLLTHSTLPDDAKILTESEVTALMANPLQLSSETFRNLSEDDDNDAAFTVEVQYNIHYENWSDGETMPMEFDSLRRYLLECRKESRGRPQPQTPLHPADGNLPPPLARPPLPDNARRMTEDEVTALMELDPMRLTSKIFYNLPGSKDGGVFEIEVGLYMRTVRYYIRFEDCPEALPMKAKELRSLLLDSHCMDV